MPNQRQLINQMASVTRLGWPSRSSPPTPTPSTAGSWAAARRSRPDSWSFSRPSTTRAGSRWSPSIPPPAWCRVARYEPAEQHGAADVAIAVILGWRGVGLASELLHVLAQARRQGHLGRFTGLRRGAGTAGQQREAVTVLP